MKPFEEIFQSATGYDPYPYQTALAEGKALPKLMDIPTGLGKTAAVILAWVWRRRFAGEATARTTPRRLVYCLPMRTLVEQTRANALRWLENLDLLGEAGSGRISVHLLMGGAADSPWELHPEEEAILIGTQDMLLSRALNRGYSQSRYAWPVHFGLLHNGALWVYDETQLMGVGVETGAQLEGLRRKLGTAEPSGSLWMSATLGRRQLETIDHPPPPQGWLTLRLDEADHRLPGVRRRLDAGKEIRSLPWKLDKETLKDHPGRLAESVVRAHQSASLTLVVLNRVERAQLVYRELLRLPGRDADNTGLVHSRFRPQDRRVQERLLWEGEDAIVVCTQAVEAGVDVSARVLFTELAPWPCIVQRLGRCNRSGEFESAQVYWIDIEPAGEKDPLCLPYSSVELERSRRRIRGLSHGGPAALAQVDFQPVEEIRPVIRRKDLLDLFDTTPDLSGLDIDVSPYIRDEADNDISFYWREVPEQGPSEDLPQPRREELCAVSLAGAARFLKKKSTRAWRWDPLVEAWESVDRPLPGATYLLASDSGGYDSALGWTGQTPRRGEKVREVPSNLPPEDSLSREIETNVGRWVELQAHLEEVGREVSTVCRNCCPKDEWREALHEAALWHDVGKAHPVFQEMLRQPGIEHPELSPPDGERIWAKSNHHQGRMSRRGFRHELASALAFRAAAPGGFSKRNLIAFLIAAHHGKVRLSIRSLPGEQEPQDPGRLFARGVWNGESLPPVSLPDGRRFDSLALDLSCMLLGEGSWLEGTLALRDDPLLGPFRLAWLETLLRAADRRVSAREAALGEEGE